jgi:hypothetical protein
VNEYAESTLTMLTSEQPGLVDQIAADRVQRLAAIQLAYVELQGSA